MPSTTRSAAAGEDLVVGGGITPPRYNGQFNVENSRTLFQEYREYTRAVEISNSGQTVKRPLLKLSQLVPENIRWCLADTYFEDNEEGTELTESDLERGLAQHGECWTGSEVHAAEVVDTVKGLLAMRSEPTAVARIDGVRSRMEELFENPSVARIFRNEKRKWHSGPARVVTEAIVRGLKPRAFKKDVEAQLSLQGGWKDDPKAVFAVVRAEALAWRRVERHEAEYRRSGKSVSDSSKESPSSPTQQHDRGEDTCWECGQHGHRKYECPSRKEKKGGSTQPSVGGGTGTQAASSTGQPQGTRGSAQPKGTPAARGGSQYKPAAAAVAGRAAVPAGDGAQGGGQAWSGLPPDPTPVRTPAPAPESQPAYVPPGVSVVGWRALEAAGVKALEEDGIKVDPLSLQGCLIDVSIPGVVNQRVCSVKGVFDTGAGMNAVSEVVAATIQHKFPELQIIEELSQPQRVRVVDGQDLVVTQRTCPLRIAIHTAFGPRVVSPERFVVLPGSDDVMLIGSPMLRSVFGIDIYELVGERVLADHKRRAEEKRLQTEKRWAMLREETEEALGQPNEVAAACLLKEQQGSVGGVNEKQGEAGDVMMGAWNQNDFDEDGTISVESAGQEDHGYMCESCREGIT